MRPCLLFDLDGTLVHTDHLHFQAFAELRARDGFAFPEQEFKSKVLGHQNMAILADYYPNASVVERRAISDAKEARVRELIALGEPLPPTPGLIALLDWADKLAIPRAIVTNAEPENARVMLQMSRLASRFPIVVSGEELPHGKPHPLPYLEGLRLTGGDAGRAYAFEDSVAGLRSAVAAGVPCAGIGAGSTPELLLVAGASLVAADFNDELLIADVRARLGLH
jgi:HAD superfamily hydrolase (TIGR01509 family)